MLPVPNVREDKTMIKLAIVATLLLFVSLTKVSPPSQITKAQVRMVIIQQSIAHHLGVYA